MVRKSLGSINDIKADDHGIWNRKGKPMHKYKVSCLVSGEVYGADFTSSDDDLVKKCLPSNPYLLPSQVHLNISMYYFSKQ